MTVFFSYIMTIISFYGSIILGGSELWIIIINKI